MGETQVPNQVQDEREQMIKEIQDRALKFVKENEAIIVLKILIAEYKHDMKVVQRLSRLFVALHFNLHSERVRLERWTMYGYSYNEMEFNVGWLSIDSVEVHVHLPNGEFLGVVTIHFDCEKLLEKNMQLEIKRYQEFLKEIVQYIEESIQELKKDES